jgi:hypothetical protein
LTARTTRREDRTRMTTNDADDLEPIARYRRDGDKVIVELALRSARQLFDVRDPAPFRARDLDDDAERWLLDAAEELPRKTPMAFQLHLAEPLPDGLTERTVVDAIRAHLRYLLGRNRRDLRALMRQGLVSGAMAVALLALCMAIELSLQPLAAREHWAAAVREGVVIFGWVALWRPMETFLFSWWPHAARARLLRRVLAADFSVQPAPDGTPGAD